MGIFELADVALGYAVNTNPHDSVARRYLALTQFAASPDDVLSKGSLNRQSRSFSRLSIRSRRN